MIAQSEYTDQANIYSGEAGGKLTPEQAAEQTRLLDFKEKAVRSSGSGLDQLVGVVSTHGNRCRRAHGLVVG